MKAKNFIINPNLIKKGDILLTTEKKSILSFAIRKKLNFKYSHALICMREYCYEINGDGVIVSPLEQKIFSLEDDVTVLRFERKLSPKEINKLENYLKSKRGASYNIPMAIKSANKDKNNDEIEGQFFCSHLVAKAYEEIGIKLCNDTPMHKITPKDLYESPFLIEVKNDVKTEIRDPDTLDYLNKKQKTNELLQKAEKILVDRTNKTINKTVKNFLDFFKLTLCQALSVDEQKFIISIHEEIEYFKIIFDDIKYTNLDFKNFIDSRDFYKNARNTLESIYAGIHNSEIGVNIQINEYFRKNHIMMSKIFAEVYNNYIIKYFPNKMQFEILKENNDLNDLKKSILNNFKILVKNICPNEFKSDKFLNNLNIHKICLANNVYV